MSRQRRKVYSDQLCVSARVSDPVAETKSRCSVLGAGGRAAKFSIHLLLVWAEGFESVTRSFCGTEDQSEAASTDIYLYCE